MTLVVAAGVAVPAGMFPLRGWATVRAPCRHTAINPKWRWAAEAAHSFNRLMQRMLCVVAGAGFEPATFGL